MWMVCVERPVAAAAEHADEAAADCQAICVRDVARTESTAVESAGATDSTPSGDICLLPANGDGGWNGVAAFAMALPVAAITVGVSSVTIEAHQKPPALYLSPPLTSSTPPPEA